MAEEFGILSGVTLLVLYAPLINLRLRDCVAQPQPIRKTGLSRRRQQSFLFVFINIAMVTRPIPVVGVPLPLISYGGTALLTVMFGVGLVMSVYVDRDVRLNRTVEAQPD